jgi:hypothetical protein
MIIEMYNENRHYHKIIGTLSSLRRKYSKSWMGYNTKLYYNPSTCVIQIITKFFKRASSFCTINDSLEFYELKIIYVKRSLI